VPCAAPLMQSSTSSLAAASIKGTYVDTTKHHHLTFPPSSVGTGTAPRLWCSDQALGRKVQGGQHDSCLQLAASQQLDQRPLSQAPDLLMLESIGSAVLFSSACTPNHTCSTQPSISLTIPWAPSGQVRPCTVIVLHPPQLKWQHALLPRSGGPEAIKVRLLCAFDSILTLRLKKMERTAWICKLCTISRQTSQ